MVWCVYPKKTVRVVAAWQVMKDQTLGLLGELEMLVRAGQVAAKPFG